MVVTVLVVLALAAAAGFLGQQLTVGRHPHDRRGGDAEGLPVSELVILVRTMAALMLAFVLVAVFQSFQRATDESAREAGAVLAMGESAVLLQPDARREVLGRLRCYARAVVGPDWRSQDTDGRPSPTGDAAADAIAVALAAAAADGRDSTALGAVLSSNATRIETRIQRVAQGRPSVPDEVWVLLLVTVAISVGGLAALGHPGVRRRMQLALLTGTTVVFGLTLIVMHDLDRPYDGPARIEPDAMRVVEQRLAALPGADPTLPCDPQGRPVPA